MLLQPRGFSSVLFSHADLNRTNICLGGLANGQGLQLLYLVPSQAFGLSGLCQGFSFCFLAFLTLVHHPGSLVSRGASQLSVLNRTSI